MRRLVTLVAVAAASAVASTQAHGAPPPPCPRTLTTVTGQEAADCLARGPLVLSEATVHGTIDLRSFETVGHALVCRRCRLDGLLASDISFAKTIDLTGSRISGPLALQGTIFEGPVLLTAVKARAPDFSLALFEELAGFDQARFAGGARFGRARFRSDVSFASTRFLGAGAAGRNFSAVQTFDVECQSGIVRAPAGAFFASASFAGSTSFAHACFQGWGGFSGAAFTGATIFSDTVFAGGAHFGGAVFGNRADFTNVRVYRGASFDRAELSRGAIFLGATFQAPTTGSAERAQTIAPAASFTQMGSDGRLDFTFTTASSSAPFRRDPHCADGGPELLTFSGTIAELDLSKLEVTPAGYRVGIDTGGASIRSLVMGLDAAAKVNDCTGSTNQREVLKLIGATAKAQDDLGLANEAHYRYEELLSRTYGGFRRFFAERVYGNVAGYLVAPLNPVLTLLALAALMAFLKALRPWLGSLRRARRDRPAPRRVRRVTLRPARRRDPGGLSALRTFPGTFLDTLLLVGPQRWTGGEGRSLRGRLEVYVYRTLLACALIALASSNPTLRQLVDAVI